MAGAICSCCGERVVLVSGKFFIAGTDTVHAGEPTSTVPPPTRLQRFMRMLRLG